MLSPDVNNQDLADTPELSSQCFACFNIASFRDLKAFQADAEAYIDRLHQLPMKEGAGAAKYPGEIEYTHKQENLRQGVVLPETLTRDLIALGESFGLDGKFLEAQETSQA